MDGLTNASKWSAEARDESGSESAWAQATRSFYKAGEAHMLLV